MATSDAMEGRVPRVTRMHAPFAQPGANRIVLKSADEQELPSIQDYLDELPSIDDYVWAGDSESDDMRSIQEYLEDAGAVGDTFDQPAAPADYDDAGWAIADWQTFDWNAAAMLGSRPNDGVAESRVRVAQAPVGGDRPGSRQITPSADEVARALDGIAQRIRSGELLIDQLTGAPPEAAMAAALAALLRMRD